MSVLSNLWTKVSNLFGHKLEQEDDEDFDFLRGFPPKNSKENFSNLKVTELRSLAKERGLKGYTSLRKADLVMFLEENY